VSVWQLIAIQSEARRRRRRRKERATMTLTERLMKERESEVASRQIVLAISANEDTRLCGHSLTSLGAAPLLLLSSSSSFSSSPPFLLILLPLPQQRLSFPLHLDLPGDGAPP
jgi:hypothetical protein